MGLQSHAVLDSSSLVFLSFEEAEEPAELLRSGLSGEPDFLGELPLGGAFCITVYCTDAWSPAEAASAAAVAIDPEGGLSAGAAP